MLILINRILILIVRVVGQVSSNPKRHDRREVIDVLAVTYPGPSPMRSPFRCRPVPCARYSTHTLFILNRDVIGPRRLAVKSFVFSKLLTRQAVRCTWLHDSNLGQRHRGQGRSACCGAESPMCVHPKILDPQK